MEKKVEQVSPATDEAVVPVIEEQTDVGTRRIKTGSVRIDKQVEHRLRKIEAPLVLDDVEVRRVAVNRVVEKAPPTRTQGNTLIIPVVEEELIVTKRLVVKEEIHVIRRRTKKRVTEQVEVARERAQVRRLNAEGQVIDPEPENPTPGRGKPWRSVLG